MRHKYLLTTRFNDDTWIENELFRSRHDNIQCVYGSPQQIASKVHPHIPICVVEMNNSNNQILGIGLIRNEPTPRYEYLPYSCGNYNRFVYIGFHRLNREDLPQELVDILEHILFKEKTHMKRGAGFTTVPNKLLTHQICKEKDIIQEIVKIFVLKYKNCHNYQNT